MIPDLIEQYVDTGKVRFVYREFPLDPSIQRPQSIGSGSVRRKSGQYWEMNEKLFETVAEWADAGIPLHSSKAMPRSWAWTRTSSTSAWIQARAATVVEGDLLAGRGGGRECHALLFHQRYAHPWWFAHRGPGSDHRLCSRGRTCARDRADGADWRVRGDTASAGAITVAFVDYASPESGQHAREVLPELVDSYIDSGQLLYILHPWSQGEGRPSARAAVAAECAGQQGQYWEMHDQLFDEQEAWSEASETGDGVRRLCRSPGPGCCQV